MTTGGTAAETKGKPMTDGKASRLDGHGRVAQAAQVNRGSARMRTLSICATTALMLLALIGVTETFEDKFWEGFDAYRQHDYATALRILRPLAEDGHTKAQYYLGVMYERGEGVPRSARQSVMWFKRGAEAGDAPCQAALAHAYAIGEALPQSDAEALKWFRKAARQGNANAQFEIGYYYQHGLGMPKNYILAYMWYTVSAHDGWERDAKDFLAQIAPDLAPSQIAEAQRLAERCIQSNFKTCNE